MMNKKETITIIRSLLSSTNASWGIYTLNNEFRNETGIDIPLFGYSSLSQFLESIPDTVKLTGLYPIQKVSLVKNDTSAHIVSLVKRQRRDKKCKKGASIGTGGYFFKNSRDSKFKAFNDKKFDHKQNGLPNLSQSKASSPMKPMSCPVQKNYKEKSNTKQNKELDNGEIEILSPKNGFERKNQKSSSGGNHSSNSKQMESSLTQENIALKNCSQEKAPKANIQNLFLTTSFFYVQNNEKIPPIDLKLYAKVGHYVEVHPCEIYHPGHFYLQFRELKKKLTKFMNELQEFYCENEKIPYVSETPKREQIFTVFYSRLGDFARWYRVQVEEILSDCLVVVRFVDYGTTTKILVKNLKLLHRNFISLPRQAVVGSLANIKPFGGRSEWSKAAIEKFHELAFSRDLVGGVVSVDYDLCRLSVALSSTTGEELHVNDTLVEKGLAEFEADVMGEGERKKSEVIETEEKIPKSVTEPDLPPPVYFSNKGHQNSRLQKMFTAWGDLETDDIITCILD